MTKLKKTVKAYGRIYQKVLKAGKIDRREERLIAYMKLLTGMYRSELFKKHNVYPSTNTTHIYAVIAMCLELKKLGFDDRKIIETVNAGFERRRNFFKRLIKCVNILPNSFDIARKWNIEDHDKRVKDGSITYDYFNVSKDKVEYDISKCMYVEMFKTYGIRELCKIFCMTDESAYSHLTKHVKFIRHSDLSDGPACHDEVIRK